MDREFITELPMFRRKQKPSSEMPVESPVSNPLLQVEAVISLGHWYPRTTLHLQEVYNFLANQMSDEQRTHQLSTLHYDLEIVSVARQAGYLEYVRAMTVSGLEIRYYEDGLCILEVVSHDPKTGQQLLTDYHSNKLQPALQELFAKGTPTPEMPQLSDAKKHPAIVAIHWPHPSRFEPDPQFGPVFSKVSAEGVAVFKLTDFIFVVHAQPGSAQVRDLLEMQLFFEQFQVQLDLSLQHYRQIWSDAAVIAERSRLKPGQAAKARAVLFQLRKRAAVAEGRLQQSVVALQTRSDIAQQLELDQHLVQLFHYRFEVLEDSLRYLEHSWRMTLEYIDQTSQLIDSLAAGHGRTVGKWSFALLFLLLISSLVGWLVKDQVVSVDHGNFMSLLGVLLAGLGLFWLVNALIQNSDFMLKHRVSENRPAPAKSAKSSKAQSKSKAKNDTAR